MSKWSRLEARALEAIRTAPGGSITYDQLTVELKSDARSVHGAVNRLLDEGEVERTAGVLCVVGPASIAPVPPAPGTLAHRVVAHLEGHPGDGFARIRTALQVTDAGVLWGTLQGLARAGLIVRSGPSSAYRYSLPDAPARSSR